MFAATASGVGANAAEGEDDREEEEDDDDDDEADAATDACEGSTYACSLMGIGGGTREVGRGL
jgi:hypothetical protein